MKYKRIAHNRTHNMSKTRAYFVWRYMLNRCYWEKGPDFKNYGGRGIVVCDDWHKFENFLADMGVPPIGMEIERVDNDGPYSQPNCRWATHKEQAHNRRSNVVLTYQNETHLLVEWAAKLNIKYGTLWNRIYHYKWSIERAFTEGIRDVSIYQ